MLWVLMLEEDRMYVGHIQVRIYKAASEEGASMTRASIAEGSPPGAQNPAPASCLQVGSLVRQEYIALEG